MKSPQAQAAAMIRKELKAWGIKARVTSEGYSMGSSINIKLTDELPATVQKIEAYAKQFQYGHFDGMTDMYESSNSRDDIPQAKFVFVENSYSDEIKQECWEWMADRYASMEDAPASFKDGRQFRIDSEWGDMRLYRELSSTDAGGFWSTKKPRVKAA